MHILAAIGGCGLLMLVPVDTFDTIVLARRTPNMLRIARAFYWMTWTPVAILARKIKSGRRRELLLDMYGPLSADCAVELLDMHVGFGVRAAAMGSACLNINALSTYDLRGLRDLYEPGAEVLSQYFL